MNLRKEVIQLMTGLMNEVRTIPVSTALIDLANEIVDVPERPAGYKPKFIEKKPRTVILVTGGLDSTAAYLKAVENQTGKTRRFPPQEDIIPLYVDIEQPYAMKEKAALSALGIWYRTEQSEITWSEELYWKHIIPGRNLLFMIIAAEHLIDCGGKIIFGAVNGEIPLTGGDKSAMYLMLINGLFAKYPNQIEVETPLMSMTKTDIVAYMEKVSPGTAAKTISCFSSTGTGHCGACQACLRKWVAFTNNGLKLETREDIKVGCAEYITKYKTLMAKIMETGDFTKYTKRRCEQTLKALATLE